MVVDNGLPDFRGTEGFWRAYPAFEKLELSFEELANPKWFKEDPQLALGFYGYRGNIYRDTQSHNGFQIIKEWMRSLSTANDKKAGGGFIFT